jgi:hypothetical protein
MANHLFVVAYHGCDEAVAERLVNNRAEQHQSSNRYDWLGKGAYFFENDAARALKFAQNAHTFPEKKFTAKPINKPAVVGAVIRAQYVLDINTQEGIELCKAAAPRVLALAPLSPLKNKQTSDDATSGSDDVILRLLDRAIIDFVCTENYQMQVVRGAFAQGKRIAETSEIRDQSHVQLAVRDLSCIEGYFYPRHVGE